ncbi:hypothetical protein I6G82_07065 [Lysinibacillus macroides]|uniref:hypothetical protein n=1 Tax=Lysinibacillus macroides TaxID=33935 RepID=UPI00128F2C07|nr:hypothetical protein [Lysinibacillus macroides]QPR69358.1 hypothetical protein I6G82_07065 [Lysinibacillus macroides]
MLRRYEVLTLTLLVAMSLLFTQAITDFSIDAIDVPIGKGMLIIAHRHATLGETRHFYRKMSVSDGIKKVNPLSPVKEMLFLTI